MPPFALLSSRRDVSRVAATSIGAFTLPIKISAPHRSERSSQPSVTRRVAAYPRHYRPSPLVDEV